MPRNKLLTLLLLVIASGARAEEKAVSTYDSALTASAGLKARADAVSKRALQALKGAPDESGSHQEAERAHVIAPHLIEIGGVDGRLFATFDLGDGTQAEYIPGQTVPKWGRIIAITPGAVEREDHHFFPPED